jgi:branched-chain amino acid transport system permease protein
MFMATNVGGGVRPEVAVFAFAALPAIYLGGAGSPLGAVVGGLLIGLSQQYAAGYAPEWLGQGFSTVFPFLVLIAVLLVRPQGIFGTRAVRRA